MLPVSQDVQLCIEPMGQLKVSFAGISCCPNNNHSPYHQVIAYSVIRLTREKRTLVLPA